MVLLQQEKCHQTVKSCSGLSGGDRSRFEAGVAWADTMTVNAVVDMYISGASPYTNTVGDDINVRSNTGVYGTGDGMREWGVVQFDLSGVTAPITGANLELFLDGWSGNNILPFSQAAKQLVAPTDISTYCWSTSDTEASLDSLGYYLS